MKTAGCIFLLMGLGLFITGAFFSTEAVTGVNPDNLEESLGKATQDAQLGTWLVNLATVISASGLILLIIALLKRSNVNELNAE